MATPATNELVMSNDEIASALGSDTQEPAGEADGEGLGSDDGDEVPTTWTDEESDQDNTEAETASPARPKGAQAVREIKANGKVHKVNMADQAAVDQLLTLGLGARPVFTERDQLRKAVKTKDAQLADATKYKDLWNKLEARKHDKEGLYEQIFGEKWADAVAVEAKRQADYSSASPEERRWMDYKREMDADKRQRDAEKREWDEQKKTSADKEHAADLKVAKSQLNPEFYKFEFSERVKDPAQAAKMNKALWKLTISELREQYGDQDEIPAHAIRTAFKETHDMLWSNHKAVATEEVKKITETKKKASKEQAQLASTRNYGSGGKSLDALAKEKDPVKLWKKMFR